MRSTDSSINILTVRNIFVLDLHYKIEPKQDQNSDEKSPVNESSITSTLKEFLMIMDHRVEVAIIGQTFIASLPICYCPLFSHPKKILLKLFYLGYK